MTGADAVSMPHDLDISRPQMNKTLRNKEGCQNCRPAGTGIIMVVLDAAFAMIARSTEQLAQMSVYAATIDALR